MLDVRQAGYRTSTEELHEPAPNVLERVTKPVGSGTVVLTSGRRFEAEAGIEGDLLRIRAPGGQIVLSVLVTDRGPVLRFESAALDISSLGRVAIDCESFDLRAREGIDVTAGGSLTEKVQGDTHRIALGAARHEAHDIELRAEPGSVAIRANDDVDLKGERIKLNCDPAPMARSWEEFIARIHEGSDGR